MIPSSATSTHCHQSNQATPNGLTHSENDSACEVEHVSCDLCGEDKTKHVLSTVDRRLPFHLQEFLRPPDAREWTLVRCQNCNLIYLNPRPTQQQLLHFYPSTYYAYRSHLGNRGSWKQRVKRLLRRNPTFWKLGQYSFLRGATSDIVTEQVGWVMPDVFLDVGCGSGRCLDRMSELGWETHGIDVSPQAVTLARQNGHTVSLGDISEVEIPSEYFDVINMSHVLEHVRSPRSALLATRKALKPTGILLIEVPDIESVWSLTFGEFYWGLDLPRHLYHFSQRSLEQLLQDTGFEVCRIEKRATPNSLLGCISILLSAQRLQSSDVSAATEEVLGQLVGNLESLEALQPFCARLEELGHGNHLKVIATCRN